MSNWEPVIQRGTFLEGEDLDRWTGTERAMLSKHPDKFSKEACKDKGKKSGKLCPYAISASMEKKGDEPHYKKQKTSLKGKPEKKSEFKDEDKKDEQTLWSRWLVLKESHSCCDAGKNGKPCECKDKSNKTKETKMSCQCPCSDCKDGKCADCSCSDCKCAGCDCKN